MTQAPTPFEKHARKRKKMQVASPLFNATGSGFPLRDGQLSFLEEQWTLLFQDSKYPAVRLALVFFLVHEIVFIGSYLPYIVCDHVSFLRRYKIQQEKQISTEQWWKCVTHVLAYQLLFEMPMMMAFHPTAMFLGMTFLQVPFPSWYSP
jgi:methylsterol monooxygenase